MTEPSRAAGARSTLFTPAVVLGLLTWAIWLLAAVWPRLIRLYGLEYKGTWFLDSYAILATLDARRAGLDPLAANPLDLLHRSHVYSDWWYGLQWLGLTRRENFLLGASWVLAFFVTAFAVLRVRRWPDAFAGFLVLASPPVLLAINRGNNDLVIFALLALAGLLLAEDKNGRIVAAGLVLALATGLKFYPAVAASFLVLVRPAGRFVRFSAGLGIVLLLVVANGWSQGGRGVLPMALDVHKLGSMILVRDLGFDGPVAQAVAALLLLALGGVLAARGVTRGLALASFGLRERMCFVLGASVLLACFLTGISFGYRWIYLILVLPWLGQARTSGEAGAPARGVVRLTFGLIFFVVWTDGLFCLACNLDPLPIAVTTLDRWNYLWRLGTQPFSWLLVALLMGWLGDAAAALLRDVRRAAGSTPAGS